MCKGDYAFCCDKPPEVKVGNFGSRTVKEGENAYLKESTRWEALFSEMRM